MRSLLFLIICANAVFAQRNPDWTEYDRRQSLYPENEYLVGFYSETNIAQADQILFERMSSAARKQLIESIQVSLKSTSTSQIINENQKTQEYFKNTTLSLAKADIVGLQYLTHYDRKNKTAYGFAYAKRSEVIAYYRKLIDSKVDELSQKTKSAQSFLANSDRRPALKSLYECVPLFTEIEDAQFILMVLDKATLFLKIEESYRLKTEVKAELSKLLNSKDLTLDEVAFFLAYGLKVQTQVLPASLSTQKISYQDTDLLSDFSQQFQSVFEQNLIASAGIQVDQNSKLASISGTYWEEGNMLKLIVTMSDAKGKSLSSAEVFLPKSFLDQKSIAYLPEALKKIAMLSEIEIKALNPLIEAKMNQKIGKPLEVVVLYKGQALDNVPITFSYPDGKNVVCQSVKTDKQGSAKCSMARPLNDKKMQIINATLDLAAWVGLAPNSALIEKTGRQQTIPFARFTLKVSGLSVFMESDERNLGQPLDIKIIEPTLKEMLSQRGFVFLQDPSLADLTVSISAASREGGNYQNSIYFSFVDATVSVLDMSTGEEVYKKVFVDKKGGAGNYKTAGVKAYKEIAEQVSKEMAEILSK
jgi:hypothetical protein